MTIIESPQAGTGTGPQMSLHQANLFEHYGRPHAENGSAHVIDEDYDGREQDVMVEEFPELDIRTDLLAAEVRSEVDSSGEGRLAQAIKIDDVKSVENSPLECEGLSALANGVPSVLAGSSGEDQSVFQASASAQLEEDKHIQIYRPSDAHDDAAPPSELADIVTASATRRSRRRPASFKVGEKWKERRLPRVLWSRKR